MFEPLTRRLEQLMDDERGVSPVVGFVLIFALIMLVFTIYQVDVVPAQNEEVEFEHSQTVEGQMEQLSAAVISTGNNTRQSTQLQLGVRYPTRVMAINPGSPVGTLNTTGPYEVRISGDEGVATLNTSFINYLPNYNRVNEEAQLSIENGMVVKDFSGSENTLLASDGALFRGGTVSLPLLSGDLQRSEMSTVVTPTTSVRNHSIDVTADSATISLPTTLSQDRWSAYISKYSDHIAEDEWSYTGGSAGVNRVTLPLKNTETIRVDKKSVGDPDPDADNDLGLEPRITNVTPLHPEVEPLSSKTRVTVRTTDIFGSSLSGKYVDITNMNGSGTLSTTTAASGGDGNVTFSYDPADADSGSTVGITAELSNRTSGENRSVTFGLEYPERYIVKESPDSPDASTEESEQLAVSVLDGNDDPLSNVNLEASEDGDGSITTSTATTNDTGGATFTYEPADSDSGSTVTVTIEAPNGSENGPAKYELEFPPESGTPPGDLGPQLSVSKGSLEEGPTDLIFRVTPSNVDIEKFSVTTKASLEGITGTIPTHGFDISTTKYIQGEQGSAGGLHFTQPIQFDGTVYPFDEGTRRVSSSLVQLKKFDSDREITFTDFVDTYAEADIVVTFITDDGTKRPVYIEATTGSSNGG